MKYRNLHCWWWTLAGDMLDLAFCKPVPVGTRFCLKQGDKLSYSSVSSVLFRPFLLGRSSFSVFKNWSICIACVQRAVEARTRCSTLRGIGSQPLAITNISQHYGASGPNHWQSQTLVPDSRWEVTCRAEYFYYSAATSTALKTMPVLKWPSDEHWNHFKVNIVETSERQGGAHMGFSKHINTILNWSGSCWICFVLH